MPNTTICDREEQDLRINDGWQGTPFFDRLSEVPSSQLIVAEANLDRPPNRAREGYLNRRYLVRLAPLSRR